MFCGALIIKCMSAKKNYNPEEVKLLIHILLSHHGKGEYGAAVAPAIPEAFAVHHIDNMDAKITQCEKIYEEIGGGTITEKRPFAFDNRLYNAKWYALLIISVLSIVYGLTTVKFFAFLESAGAEKSANMSIFGAVFFMPIALFVGALIFRRRVTLNEKSPWSYSRNKTKGKNFKISVTEAESRYKYFNYGTAAVAFGDRQRSLAHHLEPFADIP